MATEAPPMKFSIKFHHKHIFHVAKETVATIAQQNICSYRTVTQIALNALFASVIIAK